MTQKSIFNYIVDNLENEQLPVHFSLKGNEPETIHTELSDGERDSKSKYNPLELDKRNLDGIVNEIENAVVLLSNKMYDEADRWFGDIGNKYGIINIADILQDYVGENHENLYADNIFNGALYLMLESTRRESVKAGIVLIDLFEYEYDVKNYIRVLGLSDEFTLFSAKTMMEWENSNLEIFEMAKRVYGWGRIHAIETMDPDNRFIRDWILKEGVRTVVPVEKLPKEYLEKINKLQKMQIPDQYLYCNVIPYGMEQSYAYIFPGDTIAIGDKVVVPFGNDDELVLGKVVDFKWHSSKDAPYPPDKLKEVMRVLDNQEIVDQFKEIAEIEGIKPKEDQDKDDFKDEKDSDIKPFPKADAEVKVAGDTKDKPKAVADSEEENGRAAEDQMEADTEDDENLDTEDEEQDEIHELVDYIKEDDLESILEWAIFHDQWNDCQKIMENVVDAYRYCIENEYEVDTAALNLGNLYYSGVAVPRDYAKAAQYYQMAADKGSVQAICNLGYCYYYGRHQAVDYGKAYGCFNMAGLMGSSNALYKLGDMYLNGRYVDKNEEIAFKIYERAAENVNEWEEVSADIDMRLGRCYLRGLGVEKDPVYAMKKLCSAYAGLYERADQDPFVKGVIKTCKDLISECEEELKDEFVERI